MDTPHDTIKDFPHCPGTNIRKLRQERNLTLKELADLIGETEAGIKRIENGDRSRLSYTVLENIAAVFCCDMQTLLAEENSNLSKAAVRDQLLICIRQMARILNSEEQRYRDVMRQHHNMELLIGELAVKLDQL